MQKYQYFILYSCDDINVLLSYNKYTLETQLVFKRIECDDLEGLLTIPPSIQAPLCKGSWRGRA